MKYKYSEEDIKKIEKTGDYFSLYEIQEKLYNLKNCIRKNGYYGGINSEDFKILEDFLNIKPLILEVKEDSPPKLTINFGEIDVNFTIFSRTKKIIKRDHYCSEKGFTRGKWSSIDEVIGEEIIRHYDLSQKEIERLETTGYKLLLKEWGVNTSRCYLVNVDYSLEKIENITKLDFFNFIYEKSEYYLNEYNKKFNL